MDEAFDFSMRLLVSDDNTVTLEMKSDEDWTVGMFVEALRAMAARAETDDLEFSDVTQ